MPIKERNQNPTVGDTIRLRFLTFNANSVADPDSFDKIEVYQLDENQRTPSNPQGRMLVQTLSAASIVRDAEGEYHYDVSLVSPTYVTGDYLDIWYPVFNPGDDPVAIDQQFSLFSPLWITSPTPIHYDFTFQFTPNTIVKGSKKDIIIKIQPNVPRATDLERYYYNLAVVADLRLSLAQKCGPCTPKEEDLRLVLDEVVVTDRDKCFGFYWLDTSDMECGIYDLWFTLNFGRNTYISDKMPFQIYQ